MFLNKSLIILMNIVLMGCVSFESTLATNIDIEANTYELAMGYNKEDSFNLLAFGNIGFLLENTEALVCSFGLEYEKYFNDTVGISGRIGYRHKQWEYDLYYGNYSWQYNSYKHIDNGFMMQMGLPFSWSYGKITPYIGVTFYEKPKFNLGISFALRNQAVAITLIALGSAGEQWNETGRVYDNRGRQIATIYTRDREQEKINQEIAAESIVGIMGMTVEDKMPYPAWKWRTEYEGIYWKYEDGNLVEIEN